MDVPRQCTFGPYDGQVSLFSNGLTQVDAFFMCIQGVEFVRVHLATHRGFCEESIPIEYMSTTYYIDISPCRGFPPVYLRRRYRSGSQPPGPIKQLHGD
jgi:hypothetical protein